MYLTLFIVPNFFVSVAETKKKRSVHGSRLYPAYFILISYFILTIILNFYLYFFIFFNIFLLLAIFLVF